jgi:hypothetical protein
MSLPGLPLMAAYWVKQPSLGVSVVVSYGDHLSYDAAVYNIGAVGV